MSDLLPAVGGMAFRRFGFVQSSIISRWNEIVGERYAHVTAPESIRFSQGRRDHGVLTVTVVPAHAPMMQHVAPIIVERVNRFFGYSAIDRVTLKQGEVTRRAVAPIQRPEPKPLTPEQSDSLKPIADPELRAVLEALARGVSDGPSPMPVVGKIS